MRTGRLHRFIVIGLAVLVGGCVSEATRDLLPEKPVVVQPGQVAGKHRIFVSTTRQRSERAQEVFGGGRSLQPAFGAVDITVPAIHQRGAIERRKKSQPADPSRFFVAESINIYGGESQFEQALREDIRGHDGRALVFIHGYNTAFDGSVYRMTQIIHDSGYKGTPVLFTWASGGKTVDYVYDNNSATSARDALENTLRIVSRSGAKRVDIIAHSMGNWVTVEALRQLAIAGDRDLNGKLGDVVLASPDIDVDVFKTQMARYGVPKRPFILFLSNDDRALRLSGFIAGKQPRVGDYGNAEDLSKLGVVTVDLSQVKTDDRLGHTKFADNPVVIQLLGQRLASDNEIPTSEEEVNARVAQLTSGLTQTLTSTAEIVITTPLQVIKIAAGQ
jgi:esterase/lipase superfamily enzyme